ncbi:MAG: hypothetical protein NUV93_07770 [Firmicutes bacterium]|nr:hypothetical protein [Bacillota bacterium]
MRLRVRSSLRLTGVDRRRTVGAILVFAGAVVLVRTVPLWVWLAFTGAGLAWMGWSMFWQ